LFVGTLFSTGDTHSLVLFLLSFGEKKAIIWNTITIITNIIITTPGRMI